MNPTTPPTRPNVPPGYGLAPPGQYLDWREVDNQLAASRNYWLVTTRIDGRPHAMPLWGVWIERALYFGTDPASVKGKNLARSPECVIHLESGDDVVVLEGEADAIDDTAAIDRAWDAYEAKYNFRPGPPDENTAVYRFRPAVAFAWREADYPASATRWRFGPR